MGSKIPDQSWAEYLNIFRREDPWSKLVRTTETPQRKVYIDTFWIDKYEVTNEWYMRFMRAKGYRLERTNIWNIKPRYRHDSRFNKPNQPVVGIFYYAAREFCKWLPHGRLPTEAEWEKAARGTDGRRYPWGNKWNPDKVIWQGNSGGHPHPVNREYNTNQSPYGAVDMAGNVREMGQDYFWEDYYKVAPNRNPPGPTIKEINRHYIYRVKRGGGSISIKMVIKYDFRETLRTAYRSSRADTNTSKDTGFRCVRNWAP